MDFKTIKGVKTISFLALFLIVAAGAMLIAYPLFTSTQTFAQEYSVAESERSDAEAKLSSLQTVKDTINDVIKLDAESARAFPSSANTPELVEDITRAATDAGLSISGITDLTTGIPVLATGTADATAAAPAPAEGEAAAASPDAASTSTLAEMTITLSAEGSLDELIKFSENLKSTDKRNMLISAYSIGKAGNENGSYNLTISGKTYIYNEIVPPAEGAPAEGNQPVDVNVDVAEVPAG
ncbi:MAG: hypothetical protein H9W81_07335 [Enterococcus sp.]|nr:hypothetical protein [Enterococcus sp.]